MEKLGLIRGEIFFKKSLEKISIRVLGVEVAIATN